MSTHCTDPTHYVHRAGTLRCDWCGEEIHPGERYATWLCYDGGTRRTVYAHPECVTAWQAAAHGCEYAYSVGGNDRPSVQADVVQGVDRG